MKWQYCHVTSLHTPTNHPSDHTNFVSDLVQIRCTLTWLKAWIVTTPTQPLHNLNLTQLSWIWHDYDFAPHPTSILFHLPSISSVSIHFRHPTLKKTYHYYQSELSIITVTFWKNQVTLSLYFWKSVDHVDLPPSPRIFDKNHEILGFET